MADGTGAHARAGDRLSARATGRGAQGPMDWDKLRVFHAVAEAGSFTHAGDTLNLSQSAVSRQISALEEALGVPLFHRHARGLLLTEQGEQLNATVREVFAKLAMTEALLTESRDRAAGRLKVTTTFGFGSTWLAPRMAEFLEQNPDVSVSLILDDGDLDLAMREADVAIRMHPPRQPDLIQRQLMTIEWVICASPAYLRRHGTPATAEALEGHRLVLFGDHHPPVPDIDWLGQVRRGGPGRRGVLEVNSMAGMAQAIRAGAGIGALPAWMGEELAGLTVLLPQVPRPRVECFFVYPEELRNSKRVAVFRDFLLGKLAER